MSVFNKNITVAPKATKKVAKDDNATVTIEGVEHFSALKALGKAIEGATKTLEGDIKGEALQTFIERGCDAKKRPDNLKTKEGKAQASVQLKVLSDRSYISEENAARLQEAGVRLDIKDEVVETFVLNPEYANNAALMAKIEKALATIKDLPEDLFLHQSQKKIVATEDSLNDIFAKCKIAQAKELLPLVSTLAIRPSTTATIRECFEVTADILDVAQ